MRRGAPSHFYDPLHGQIYETAAKLIASGKQATPITLQTFFETAERIDATLTVPQYLGRLAANAATIINARDYGQTIYDLATRRQLIVIGEDMAKAAYDSPVDFPPKEQIEEVETRLFSLAETGKYGQGFQAFRDASNAAVAMALSARKRGGGISGLATGLCTLDAKTGGLQPSDLIILAGRPSMGKTALATNIAFNVARAGTAVGFFSLEMSEDQLATRMLSERIGVSSERIRRGNLKDEEARRLIEADRELSSIPLFIDQTGGISIAQLAARARRLKRQKGLGLVVVDYLQLLSGSSMTRGEGRVQVVSEITTGLKALAKELDVPILALSQLSRAVENREEKRPLLSDLRELRLYRAGRRRGDVCVPPRILPRTIDAGRQRSGGACDVEAEDGRGRRQSRGGHRQAAARPYRPGSSPVRCFDHPLLRSHEDRLCGHPSMKPTTQQQGAHHERHRSSFRRPRRHRSSRA